MTPLQIIEQRVSVLKTQRDNETITQNVQMYEFAIMQLERIAEMIKANTVKA